MSRADSAAPASAPPATMSRETEEVWFWEVREGLARGRLVPYLGPGLTALTGAGVPATYEELAAFLESKVAVPRRAHGNLWAAAQYIESQRHRTTLVALLAEAFVRPVTPMPFHAHLGRLPLPLIVDTWYDGAMRAALSGRDDWGEIQGVTRATPGAVAWTRAYDRAGQAVTPEVAKGWATLLYKPHGSVTPTRNFLAADSDYVETLTEIDIQTPIPELVQTRRAQLGFVFLGCRFHDQLLRTYARQIVKRSAGPHYAVAQPGQLTRNELRFLAELDARVLAVPLEEALRGLAAGHAAAAEVAP